MFYPLCVCPLLYFSSHLLNSSVPEFVCVLLSVSLLNFSFRSCTIFLIFVSENKTLCALSLVSFSAHRPQPLCLVLGGQLFPFAEDMLL